MASKTAGGGRWEVVKKGRRPGAGSSGRGGGGDRRALGEANGVWKYDLTREYPPGPGPVPLGWQRLAAGAQRINTPGTSKRELYCQSAPPFSASATLALSLASIAGGRQREGGGRLSSSRR